MKFYKKFFNPVRYDFWWRLEAESEFNSYSDNDEFEVIRRQIVIPARELFLIPSLRPQFPWHGHDERDFEELHSKMILCLDEAVNIRSIKDVIAFKRKHKNVYEAYFERPICVQNDMRDIEQLRDGRHRSYTAYRLNSLIPVWITEWRTKDNTTLNEYIADCAWGEWRFLR